MSKTLAQLLVFVALPLKKAFSNFARNRELREEIGNRNWVVIPKNRSVRLIHEDINYLRMIHFTTRYVPRIDYDVIVF